MKKYLIAMCLSLWALGSIAQDWELDGNGSTDPTTDFVGTTDNKDLRFRTFNAPRMALTWDDGFLGIANMNPQMRLHVDSGGVVVTGTIGDNPNLGAGTRMMYVPATGSFRTGYVTGTQWDNTLTGEYSFAAGENVTVSGDGGSFALGGGTTVSGLSAGGLGHNNLVAGDFSYALGCALETSDDLAITIGSGHFTPFVRLNNNIPNSLMIGFNSNVPTLFVSPASGLNAFGRIGLGNVTSPTELLDANGNGRFRQIPVGPGDVLITGSQQDAAGDYALRYLAFSGDDGQVLSGDGTWVDAGAASCNWEVVNGGNDYATGYVGACVERNVGIGDLPPLSSKFYVTTVLDVAGDQGILVETTNSNSSSNVAGIESIIDDTVLGSSHAVRGIATGGKAPIGGRFIASGDDDLSRPAIGVYGSGSKSGTTNGLNTTPIGVAGFGTSTVTGGRAIGIYGEADATTPALEIAAYFVGTVVNSATPINLSDQSLKSNVQAIENGLGLISQLNPVTYSLEDGPLADYVEGEYVHGLIAQEVQEVAPFLVQSVAGVPIKDESGELLGFGEDLLGVKYQELIPILVAAVQEQQSQINALTELVNSCCSADAVDARSGSYEDDIRIVNPEGQNRLDQNAPNPFTDHTTLRFSLAKDGQAKVCIYNSNGQLIDCLIDGNTNAGEHSLIWNTTDLAPGIYFYSLEVDGFEQVRRAVKL